MRRLALLFLTLILTVSLPAVGRAEGAPVSLVVQAGFEGRAKSGTWVPVQVELKNEGAEFTGELVFKTTLDNGPFKNAGEYRTPVTVPAGATKRVPLLYPTEMMGFPEIRLVQGDAEVAAVKPDLQMSRDLLLGVLGVEPAELPQLGGMTAGDRPVRLIRLTPELVPTEAVALESLDAILLDRFTWLELPEPQRKALQGWVEHGGTLIAAGGAEGRRLEGLNGWVPLSLQAMAQVKVPGVGSAPLMDIDLKGWHVTWKAGDTVLAAKVKKGAGSVHYLAFDPALEPFASWSGLRGALEPILPGPRGSMEAMGGAPALMNLANALGQSPMREIPATGRLLMLLAIYALVIGPVHLIALRAFRRLGWALLTLPVLALAGAGGAWFYIRNIGLADVMVTTVTVMEGQPGGSTLRARSVAGVTMPPGTAAEFALGDALLTPAPAPVFGPIMEPEKLPENKAVLAQGRSAQLEPRENWEMRAVGARAMVEGGSVTGSLTVNGADIKGRLTSNLKFPLKNAMVVINSLAVDLGDLKPGDGAEVTASVPRLVQDMRQMKMGGGPHMIIEAVAQRLQPAPWGPEGPGPEQQAQMRRQQMAWSGLSSIPWLQSMDRPPAVLVGWTDYQPLAPLAGGKPVKSDNLAMYVQPIEIGYPEGDFAIPSGFLWPRVVGDGGQGAGPGGILMPGWSPPPGGATSFEFELPDGIGERVTAAELWVPMLRTDLQEYPFVLSLYNWSTGAWLDVAADKGTANLTDARRFISNTGRIRARVRSSATGQVGHYPLGVPGLSVSGKGAQ